ncbi:hypothetical protein ACN47E_000480 [Coniothyrium glycines]
MDHTASQSDVLHQVTSPLTALTKLNQNGIIAIITGFSFGLVLLSTGIRVYARRHAGKCRSDDLAFYAAVFFATGQSAMMFFLLTQGLGKSFDLIQPAEFVTIQRGNVASNLLYISVLALSKSSCALTFLWLTPFGKKLPWTMLFASISWLVASVFTEGFLHHDTPVANPSFFTHWLYIGIFDVLIEVSLISTSILIIYNRQLPLSAKFAVVAVFLCRLPNIACTVLRLVFLHKPLTEVNSAYWMARVHVTTQLAIAYTITACVIPYLRPLMQAYESDGSRRGSATIPNFKMSQQMMQTQALPHTWRNGWGVGRVVSRSQRAEADEAPFMNMDIVDIGGLLTAPQRARTRSLGTEEMKSRDRSAEHGLRRDSALESGTAMDGDGDEVEDAITPAPPSVAMECDDRDDEDDAGHIV